jgi:phospholipase C
VTRLLVVPLAVIGLLLGGVVSGSGSVQYAASRCGGLATPPPATYRHVVWIWFENRSYRDIVGNPNAPYFNQLASSCGSATSFYNETHRSWRNYMVATNGTWYTDGQTTRYNLFQQLQAAGATWKVYAQSMPFNCDPNNYGAYDRDHNAAVFYPAIASTCSANDVPMGNTTAGQLLSDLQANALPRYSQILPDNCRNMHHDCNGGDSTAAIAAGDRFLQTWIPRIVATPDYRAGQTVVFITFDEGRPYLSTGENCLSTKDDSRHIPTLVVSAYGRGQSVGSFSSHYALLHTTETLLGLPCLQLACSADPFYGAGLMRSFFGI